MFPEVVVGSNGNSNSNSAEVAWEDAKSQLVREEQDVERAISEIIEVQVCVRFSLGVTFTLVRC